MVPEGRWIYFTSTRAGPVPDFGRSRGRRPATECTYHGGSITGIQTGSTCTVGRRATVLGSDMMKVPVGGGTETVIANI